MARTDYAINAGDRGFNTIAANDVGGPATIEEGDTSFAWPSTNGFTGVCHLRSTVRPAQLVDGSSHTYLIGEKYLDIRHYDTGLVESDRGHLFIGFAPDTARLTRIFLPPRRDSDFTDKRRFGSSHVGTCFFSFCDGSVRAVNYEIDRELHRSQGTREDSA